MTEALKHWKKRTIVFFISQCITLFGSQLAQMAIVWYVTLHTNSGAWVAAFSVCSCVPQFFVSFFGGVWADRYNRKHLIIAADALIAFATLLLVLSMPHITSEPLLLAILLLVSIIRSAATGIQSPAVNALIPQLVPAAHLMRYNGVNATMQSVVQFGAPAAAAVVLTMGTLRETLLIDILTAAVGIGVFSCILLPGQPRPQTATPLFAEMKTGVRYACSTRAIRIPLMIYGLFIFLTVPAGYLSGLLVSRVYGDTYWYLTAVELAGFGGMLLGGLLTTSLGSFKSRRLMLAAGLALFGAMAIAMGIVQHFVLYLTLMALYGVALTAVQTTLTTMLQENTSAAMHGRVFGLMSSLYSICYPLGMALFGPMADAMPLQWIMVASGVALLTLALFAKREQL